MPTDHSPQSASFEIRKCDPAAEPVRALLAYHLQQMHENSPAGSVFALDISGLQAPGVTVWAAWRGKQLAGVGAMKLLGDGTAELKSMRTHPQHLRQGVAAAILEQLIAQAQAQGIRRLSLETGSGPAFEPALALYRRRGFVNGPVFSDYTASAFNQFLHLQI